LARQLSDHLRRFQRRRPSHDLPKQGPQKGEHNQREGHPRQDHGGNVTKSPERLEWERDKRQATIDARKDLDSRLRKMMMEGHVFLSTPEQNGMARRLAFKRKKVRES
jgi:hypothetical protein